MRVRVRGRERKQYSRKEAERERGGKFVVLNYR